MAEFRRNMQQQTRDCIVVYISCTYVGFVNELLQILLRLAIVSFVVTSSARVVFTLLHIICIKCKQITLKKLEWIDA
jgi:hypothetical protein